MLHFRYKFLSFILFLCLNEPLYAQDEYLDSLKKHLQTLPADTAKVNLMNKINAFVNGQNYLEVLQQTKNAVDLAERINYPLGKSVALRTMAIVYSELGKPDSALSCLNLSYEIILRLKDKKQEIYHHAALGNVYVSSDKGKEALDNLQKSLKLMDEIKDSSRRAYVLLNIGIVHDDNNNIEKARKYWQMALEVATKMKDTRLAVSASMNLGNTYLYEKEYATALTYFNEVYRICTITGKRVGKYTFNALGLAHTGLKEYTQANYYFNKCLDLATKEGDAVRTGLALNGLSEVACQQQQWALAIDYGEKSLKIAKTTTNMESYRSAYEALFKAYKGAKKFEKALDYQTLMIEAKDSIFNVEKTKQIQELETQYEVEKKESENVLLKKEKDLKDARIRQQFWVIVSSLIIIGLVAFLSIILYRSRQKEKATNVMLAEQKMELQHKNKLLEELNAVKDRLFSIISHDLRAPLNSLKSLLGLLNDKTLSQDDVSALFPKLTQDVGYTSDLLDSLLHWAKSQLHGIHVTPKKLNVRNLVEENISLLHTISEQKKITLKNNISENTIVLADEDMTRTIFRNLISNALKFTKAKGEIVISAENKENEIEIIVADTGVGMSQEVLSQLFKGNVTTRGTKNEKGTGLGLMLVKDFVEKNNGTIRVESEVNIGSKFIFTLPLAQELAFIK